MGVKSSQLEGPQAHNHLLHRTEDIGTILHKIRVVCVVELKMISKDSEEQGTVLPATLDVQAPVGKRPARNNRSKVELSKAAVADAVGTVDEASRRGKAVDSMLGPLLVRVARPVSTLSQPQRADQSGQFRRLKDSSA